MKHEQDERDHPGSRPKRRADAFAAVLLHSPAEYALAEELPGPSVAGLARARNVTPHPIRVCRRELERTGG